LSHRLSKELQEKKGELSQLVVERIYLEGYELNDTLVVSDTGSNRWEMCSRTTNSSMSNLLLHLVRSKSVETQHQCSRNLSLRRKPARPKEAGSEKKGKVPENNSENKAEEGSNLVKRKPEAANAPTQPTQSNIKEEASKPLGESKLGESAIEPAPKKKEKKKEKETKLPELKPLEEKAFKEDSLVRLESKRRTTSSLDW
jgi:hypothetical protein